MGKDARPQAQGLMLLPAVLALVQQAGEAVCEVYQGGDWDARTKADDSPLTRADERAHALLAAGLQALAPRWPVVSEEDAASLAALTSAGTFWLVDPLDGTREFIARRREFTVNVALVHHGVVRWGVVAAPALGLLYWGGAGLGAWRRSGAMEQALACGPLPPDGVPRVLASHSHLTPETQAWLQRLGPHHLLQAGSSLKFCRIAEGAADLYPRLGPTCQWDTAAAQAVLEGAGGAVRDLQGQALRYGQSEVRNPDFIAASAAWWARGAASRTDAATT
jgi:3'(2'), 5'-bisphosphate nucleotidase